MIKELQNRLTMIYTFTTGIILILVVIAISVISQLDTLKKLDETFQNHILNISTKLQTDTFFNISWIASMEADNGLILHIEENGEPLLYQSSWKTQTDRDVLIARAKEAARQLHTDISVRPISSAAISPVFTIQGTANDEYKCIAVSYPLTTGYKSLVLLYDITPALESLQIQRILFVLAAILGIAALYITARKLVKRAIIPLQISNQKQQEFIAAASHELRSPLMVIQSSAQAIETVPEKTKQFTQNITNECKRMSHLIQDMLTLASFDMQNQTISLKSIDLTTLLFDFYELYEPVCANQNVPFQLHLPEDLIPDIPGNRERLLQLLTILVDNALTYNIEKRPIHLDASVTKSYIYIKVIDHGIGIPSEQKELIFDRFYRTDHSRKNKQHFGLGLSIARELTALHNGTLQAVDTPGGGSTFIVTLPFSTGKM